MKQNLSLPGVGDIPVKRSRAFRRMAVNISPYKGIWINIPSGVSDREAELFLERNRVALLEHLGKQQRAGEERPLPWEPEGVIRTRHHLLRVFSGGEASFSCRQAGDEITLYLPQEWSRREKIDRVDHWLAVIYRRQGEAFLPGRIRHLAETHGFSYRQVALRNNRTNWGSCSAADKISLNVQLMKLPLRLIDYVILHELCHTREKNHSVRFWALMDEVCPSWRDDRRQLRTYSTRLL